MDLFGIMEENKKEIVENADKITLKSFSINNYRGIVETQINVNNANVVFVGDSGVGKTTHIEALLWLLTGKLFDGSTNGLNQYIMPKNATKETVLSVEATFDVGGETFVFTKQMSEKWVKKRGTEDIVYEGVDTTYYVNGIKKDTVKDFNTVINRAFGLEQAIERIEKETTLLKKIDLITLFLVLDFFPTLDNKTLRELVLLVAGDVKLEDVEMSDNLRKGLQKTNNSVDDLKKLIKLKLKGDKNNVGLREKKTKLETLIENNKSNWANFLNDNEKKTQEEELQRIENEILKRKNFTN